MTKMMIDKKSFIKAVIQQSSLERSYVYHLLSGEYGLTRDKLIQFAIIGGFSLEETNKLLKYAHMATLYARDTRDAGRDMENNLRFLHTFYSELKDFSGLPQYE